MNPAFKHLETKLKIAELTIRQWITILIGLFAAILYADFLHPFGTMLTIATAIYIGGLPLAAAIVSGSSEFDAWLLLKSAVRWRSADDRFLPGSGGLTVGYEVHPDANGRDRSGGHRVEELDLAMLWGEQ